MNWSRQLSELEMRALCNFVLNKENGCKVVEEKYDPNFMGEGLSQKLYVHEGSKEYVFVVSQRGYIMNMLHITSNELEEFLGYWNEGLLNPYGRIENNGKKL